MKLNKTGKRLVRIGIALLILLVGVFFFAANKKEDEAPEATVEFTEPTPTPELTEQQQNYQEKLVVNPEYIGVLKFDSGLIEQNVVQSTDNEKYLNTTWDLQEDEIGAAFFDYRNMDDDQNYIIYGHYVYYDDSAMFTKLELLLDESNYEANKTITLTIGEDVEKHYLITDVFYYDVSTDTPDYHETNYTEEDFNTYYEQVAESDLYITGESISYTDHWLTLQTCVRDHDELREIVLAKEVQE